MSESVLLGHGREVVRVPYHAWKDHMAHAQHRSHDFLSFMTPEHHQVRYFVVRELPRHGRPIEPDHIARQLSLPLARVLAILEELEKKLVFLVRNEGGAVSWAFPVTADQTPHHLTFSSGEMLYAA